MASIDKAELRTLVIATSGFDNIEGILRAWSLDFEKTQIEGLWIVDERPSFMSNLFSIWEVKNYQISLWEKVQ